MTRLTEVQVSEFPVHDGTVKIDNLDCSIATPDRKTRRPYSRDLKNIETHMLDTGHFALETHGAEIAERIQEFLKKYNIARRQKACEWGRALVANETDTSRHA
jgi:hypothetical protein